MRFIPCPICGAKISIEPHNQSAELVCGKCKSVLVREPTHPHTNPKVTQPETPDVKTNAPEKEVENPICLLCKELCTDGEVLVDGSVYHRGCYTEIRDAEAKLSMKIAENLGKISRIKAEIDDSQTIINKVKSWFFKNKIDIPSLEFKIGQIQTENKQLSAHKNEFKSILHDIYSYWPTYPPDWDERRIEFFPLDDCEKCGSDYGRMHVHHIIPLHRGGNHTIDNLSMLCEKCHSKKHGGRKFSYSGNDKPTPFSKRVKLIRDAIDGDRTIYFRYRKFEGQKSVRSIRPSGIKKVGKSLCVEGYCYLRNDNRVFAIKRMSYVKTVDSPEKGHDL